PSPPSPTPTTPHPSRPSPPSPSPPSPPSPSPPSPPYPPHPAPPHPTLPTQPLPPHAAPPCKTDTIIPCGLLLPLQPQPPPHPAPYIYSVTLPSSCGAEQAGYYRRPAASRDAAPSTEVAAAAQAYVLHPGGSTVRPVCEQVTDLLRKERRPKKPGKYICSYCGRACAKPSVLQKHIRSHTGERPYPCAPCGFSFKTKSNLYKHRKSHAHAMKAGAGPSGDEGEGSFLESGSVDEQEGRSEGDETTDSEDESGLEEMAQASSSMGPEPPTMTSKNVAVPPTHPAEAEAKWVGSLATATCLQPAGMVPERGMVVPSQPPALRSRSPKLYEATRERPTTCHPGEHQAVRQKLAWTLKLAERKRLESDQAQGLQRQPRCPPHPSLQLLSPMSKSSTDSGYFSRSESAEHQGSPPSAAPAMTYREMVLGKNVPPGLRGTDAYVSAAVAETVARPGQGKLPLEKKLIEEHISRLILHNEAVMDDKELDSVKPRRMSWSRRGSFDFSKQHPECDPDASRGATPRHHLAEHHRPPHGHAFSIRPEAARRSAEAAPLNRSNSTPVTPGYAGRAEATGRLPGSSRSSRSFDEATPPRGKAQPYPGHQRTLVRQKAIETAPKVPLESETPQRDTQPQMVHFKVSAAASEGAVGVRKRRKEKTAGEEEEFPPEKPTAPLHGHFLTSWQQTVTASSSALAHLQREHYASASLSSAPAESEPAATFRPATTRGGEDIHSAVERVLEAVPTVTRTGSKEISVIQHTKSLSRPSSFERAESVEATQGEGEPTTQSSGVSLLKESATGQYERAEGAETQGITFSVPYQQQQQQQPVRQTTLLVPEILVTEDTDKDLTEAARKEQEKAAQEFQWPQRSETLSKLPAEKLPPKKKRLRLADLQHSSNESSTESSSLSRSMSGESSSISRGSSFSASFERDDTATKAQSAVAANVAAGATVAAAAASKPSEFLTVPSAHHRREVKEMCRSSSEQGPAPEQPVQLSETRSKSLDYGSGTQHPAPTAPVVTSTAAIGTSRRRGILVRQASLSGSPDSPEPAPPQGETSSRPSWLSDASDTKQQHVQRTSSTGMSPRTPEQSASPKPSASRRDAQPPPAQRMFVPPPPAPILISGALGHLPAVGTLQPVYSLSHLHIPLSLPAMPLHRHQLPLHFQIPQAPSPPPLQRVYGCPLKIPVVQGLSTLPHLQLPFQQLGVPRFHVPQIAVQTNVPFIIPAPPPFAQRALVPRELSDAKGSGGPLFQAASGRGFTPLHPLHLPRMSQTIVATEHPRLLTPVTSLMVPVRIQTPFPSYSYSMYTTLSQMLVTQAQSRPQPVVICQWNNRQLVLGALGPRPRPGRATASPHVSPITPASPASPSHQLLSEKMQLSSLPVSGLDGVSEMPLPVAGKRMLSPASSFEIAMEIRGQNQKRAKEEDHSVGLEEGIERASEPERVKASSPVRSRPPTLLRQHCTTETSESRSTTPVNSTRSLASTDSFSKLEVSVVLEQVTQGEETDKEYKPSVSTQVLPSVRFTSNMPPAPDPAYDDPLPGKCSPPKSTPPIEIVISDMAGTATEVSTCMQEIGREQAVSAEAQDVPNLQPTTTVTWCFLVNCRPSPVPQDKNTESVYASWGRDLDHRGSCNPLGLSTKAALGLLCSRQRTTMSIYTSTMITPARADQMVQSSQWKPRLAKGPVEPVAAATTPGGAREAGDAAAETCDPTGPRPKPNRIRIFKGGYKSNEEYVYVRGRGRGKYVCEECGIRCKKPSMLRKHIRTHTDLRPYSCRVCCFAFKTKGNLTKHMKSKAHSKKCLEVGVNPTLLEDQLEEDDPGAEEERLQCWEEVHQFSDVEESEGAEDDDVDNEDDDEEEDEEGGSGGGGVVVELAAGADAGAGADAAARALRSAGTSRSVSGERMGPGDERLRSAPARRGERLARVESEDSVRAHGQEEDEEEDEDEEDEEEEEATRRFSHGGASEGLQFSLRTFGDFGGRAASVIALTLPTRAPSRGPELGARDDTEEPMVMTPDWNIKGLEELMPQLLVTSTAATASTAPLQNFLSHLPLHSQGLAWAPCRTVSVGGIHMVHTGVARPPVRDAACGMGGEAPQSGVPSTGLPRAQLAGDEESPPPPPQQAEAFARSRAAGEQPASGPPRPPPPPSPGAATSVFAGLCSTAGFLPAQCTPEQTHQHHEPHLHHHHLRHLYRHQQQQQQDTGIAAENSTEPSPNQHLETLHYGRAACTEEETQSAASDQAGPTGTWAEERPEPAAVVAATVNAASKSRAGDGAADASRDETRDVREEGAP
ncbi:unnamed protein product, partial [Lampetra planeri]